MDPPILEAPSESSVTESASAASRAAETTDSLDIATGIFNGLIFSIFLLVILLVPLAIYLFW
jgi:hypothetical protein